MGFFRSRKKIAEGRDALKDVLLFLERYVPLEEKYNPVRQEFREFRKLPRQKQQDHFVGLFLFIERSLLTHRNDESVKSLRKDLLEAFPVLATWRTFQPIVTEPAQRGVILISAIIVESIEQEVVRIYGRGKATFFSGIMGWVEEVRNPELFTSQSQASHTLKDLHNNILNVLGKSAVDRLFSSAFELVFRCYQDWELFDQIIALLPSSFLSEAHFRTFTNAQLQRLLNDNLKQLEATNSALKSEMEIREMISSDLIATKSQLQKILDNTLDAVVTANGDGTVTFWNKRAEELFGYSVEEAIGEDLSNLIIPKRHWAAHRAGMERMEREFSSSYSRMLEIDAMTKSGEEKRVGLSLVKVASEGETQYNAFIQDLSSGERLKQLEEEKRQAEMSNALKDQFMAKMSHELRTPLNGISGFTQLLREDSDLSPSQKSIIENIQISSAQLKTLVEELLDLTSIEQGKIRLNPKETKFRSTIRKSLESHRIRAQEKNIDFQLHIDLDVPYVVKFDANRYLQVLNNLISNAIKFTHQGQVSVHIYVAHRAGKAVRLCTCVRDTGPGIRPGIRERIFEPFYTESPDTEAFSGTGLGLSISDELVKMLGGNLFFSSPETVNEKGENIGSVFAFSAMVEVMADAAEKNNPGTAVEKTSLLKEKRVLIVEDNRISQMVAMAAINKFGGSAVCASSAEEGLMALKEEKVDLVLMDINLPKMNGWEASMKIKSEMKLDLPIVALSANAYPEDVQKSMNNGMMAHLAKPLQLDELEDLFRKLYSN